MSTGMLEGLKQASDGWGVKDLIGAGALGLKGYAAGSGASAARASAEATKRGLEFNAAVERNNALVREYQARDAIGRGQRTAAGVGAAAGRLAGRQRATLAGRGLSLAEGSPLAILTDTLQMGRIDMNTATDNAAREAWGFRVEGANAGARAGMYDAQAGAIDPNRVLRSSRLTGAAGVAESWYKTAGTSSPREPSKKYMDEWGVLGEQTY